MTMHPSTSSGWRRVATVFTTLVLGAIPGAAATLSFNAPMHIQPDEAAPVVGTLPHGSSVRPLLREQLAAAGIDAPPAGWIAIRSSGPFTGFVRNADVAPDGTIRPGAEIRGQPLDDAPLLLVVEEGDRTEAREPIGDWSRATIRTDLIVFVNSLPPDARNAPPAAAAPPEGSNEAKDAAPASGGPPEDVSADAPAEPTAEDAEPAEMPAAPPEMDEAPATPSSPAPAEPEAVMTAGVPRTFEGYLMRNRRLFGRPAYAYKLVDEDNRKIALLDFSALSRGEEVEAFENRRISIYGPSLQREDMPDELIIRVERLRLLP